MQDQLTNWQGQYIKYSYHIFSYFFQCFTTFAEPNFSKQHSTLLTTSNRWQTEMKFFVTLVPCCQSTKSVCHCCTTKNSIPFWPTSGVLSNCVKHSLPERPDIHIGLVRDFLHGPPPQPGRQVPSWAGQVETFVMELPIKTWNLKKIMHKDGGRLPRAPQIGTFTGKSWQIFLAIAPCWGNI